MLICFILEIIILSSYFISEFIKNERKLNITNDLKINFICLIIVTLILMLVQVYNFITKNFVFMDVMNTGAIFINIFLFYICTINLKTEENGIYTFFKCIMYMTLVSCFVNLVLYYKDILNLLHWKYNPDVMIKGFFANRNQFAFFLYLAIVANTFILVKEKNKKWLIPLVIFFISLITTVSRTGMLLVGIFVLLLFAFTNKISKRNKIIFLSIILVLCILAMIFVCNKLPDIWNKINKTLIRPYELSSFSGRTDIWKVGIDLLKENPLNLIFGIGRFKSTASLENVDGKEFTQFHNTYIDTLCTGGIIELIFYSFIYFNIIKKIIKSNLKKIYKIIYYASYITYFIYMFLESLGRFSIGASDTICLIFFITLPLLHINSLNEKNCEIDNNEKQKLLK